MTSCVNPRNASSASSLAAGGAMNGSPGTVDLILDANGYFQ
jgi:hypothetical protein